MIPIFAYGSLMNKTSALQNLSKNTVNKAIPVIAHNVYRFYDKFDNEVYLNCIYNSKLNTNANGILLLVDKKELNNLIGREKGYHLISVPITPYNPTTKIQFTNAFMFTKNSVNVKIKHIPTPRYKNIVEIGALSYGMLFYNMYKNTTH